MVRSLSILLFVCHLINVQGQPQTAVETVNKYSIAQKRLLVLSTAAFTNLITQNNLDRDSVVEMACGITGLPFLMAYEEEYDSLSAGTHLINAGKINEAVQLLNAVKGEQRIQLLSELAIWYLHKAGSYQTDLDRANYYIQTGLAATTATNNLRYGFLALLGEYYRQTGNEPESKKILLQIISSSQQDGNKNITADALHCLGKLHREIDSTDFSYLSSSLALYQQLQLKEKEIELLWDIAAYHFKLDMDLFKADLTRILDLQQSIGYQHSLFAENLMAFLLLQQSRWAETLEHANLSLENLKWSGMSAVQGNFYIRIGVVYHSLGKKDESVTWYKKALENGTRETHVYWYKSLFFLVPTLAEMNRTEEGLSILQRVTHKFPPLTLWEKGQVYIMMAYCYRQLNNDRLVDENYTSFLKLLTANPGMDPYKEFTDDYTIMLNFYLSKSNIKKARLVAELGLFDRKSSVTSDALNNYLLFKIDSVAGNYKSALDHFIKHKYFDDSKKEMEQKIAFEDLTLKYGAEKKDNDIRLLQKDKQLQGTMLVQAKNTRNWILGGLALLVIIMGLLYRQYRNKQKSNRLLQSQKEVIDKSNHELQQLNEQQTKLLTEKDWLVKEIHHRVKNNLQMVVSLLNAQTEFLTHPSAIEAIKESRERMQAIAIIHQKLYQLDNSTRINMRSYINELIDNIKNSFADSKRVHFKVDVADVGLDISQSVPLGLILNEAITNAVKYAYPKNEKGSIQVSLKRHDSDRLQLKIADNGKGLPANVEIEHSDSLGIQLIKLFSEQLEGELYFINNTGLEIRLNFKAAGYHDVDVNKIIA